MENDQEVVKFTMQVTADGNLFGNGSGRQIQIGQPLQSWNGILQYSSHVTRMKSVLLKKTRRQLKFLLY